MYVCVLAFASEYADAIAYHTELDDSSLPTYLPTLD